MHDKENSLLVSSTVSITFDENNFLFLLLSTEGNVLLNLDNFALNAILMDAKEAGQCVQFLRKITMTNTFVSVHAMDFIQPKFDSVLLNIPVVEENFDRSRASF